MRETKGLPWTFRGVTSVEDCETAEEVIQKAGLDFTVAKANVFAQMPHKLSINERERASDKDFLYGGSQFGSIIGTYATYRTDSNIPFGIVKSKYEPVQNIDAFKFFNDAIGENKAIWNTAGCFDNGRKIFVTAKLPDVIHVGDNDIIDNYLVFSNSHDGSSSVNIMLTPIRLACFNCLPGAIRSAKGQGTFLNFKHTQSVHGNINQALEILGFAKKQVAIMEVAFNRLKEKKMNDLEVMDYIASVHLNAEEYSAVKQDPNGMKLLYYRDHMTIDRANISTRKLNILCNTFDYYESGVGQFDVRGTAWGAFNAVTGFYSNVANLEGEKRMDSLVYGSAGNVCQKSLDMLAA